MEELQNLQLYQLPQLSLHYLRKFKKTHTHKAHFEINCQCILNAQHHQRQERVHVNCFQFLLGNPLNSLLAENLLHCHRFLIKFYLRNSTLGLLLH